MDVKKLIGIIGILLIIAGIFLPINQPKDIRSNPQKLFPHQGLWAVLLFVLCGAVFLETLKGRDKFVLFAGIGCLIVVGLLFGNMILKFNNAKERALDDLNKRFPDRTQENLDSVDKLYQLKLGIAWLPLFFGSIIIIISSFLKNNQEVKPSL